MKSKKYIFTFILLGFIIFDFNYSFNQFYNQSLDGDMAAIILPADHYQQILDNPLGYDAIIKGERYGGSNRFFAHYFQSKYFKTVPLFLQTWLTPIESVFASIAILKTFIQFGLLLLLTLLIPSTSFFQKLIVFAMMVPFFQTSGYDTYMAIIQGSPTYTVFYSLSSLILLFTLFYYIKIFTKQYSSHPLHYVILFILGIISVLNGPLNPAIIIVLGGIYFLYKIILAPNFMAILSIKHKLFPLIILGILSFFALYLGMANIENSQSISILDRYKLLPTGLFNIVFHKLGWPLLILTLITNYVIITKHGKNKAVVKLFRLILIFSILYILLLPLGGYRSYRPYIIRRDLMVPITLCFVYLFVYSSLVIFPTLNTWKKRIFQFYILIILMIFTIVDEPIATNCQISTLREISLTNTNEIKIDNDCLLLSWDKITNKRDSKINGQLLHYWGITKNDILYYNAE